MRQNDWKERLGIVFSTNPDYDYSSENEKQEMPTLLPQHQKLHVYFERAGRKGKTVTMIEGFVGTEVDLKALEKLLKTQCGTGGSSKDGQIIIQGDNVDRIKTILLNKGYKVK